MTSVPGRMRVGVRAGFEDLGAELVAHEDVVVQVDVHAAAAQTARHLIAQRQHLGRRSAAKWRSEPQIPHARTADQHLAGTGYGVGHVVAIRPCGLRAAPRRASAVLAFRLEFVGVLGDRLHHRFAGAAEQLVAHALCPFVRRARRLQLTFEVRNHLAGE